MTRGAVPFAAAVLLTAAAPRGQQATLLRPRASIERTLEGNAHDVYDVALREGESAAITVAQKGLDVVISSVDASGAPTAVVDDEPRKDGRERFTLIGDTSGTSRFTVAPRYPKHDAGGYAVWIDEIRPVTDHDRALVEARRLRTEESTLRTAGKLDESLDRLTKAIALAEGAAGPQDPFVGALVGEQAALQRAKGQLAESEQSFLRAIDVSQAALGRDHPQTAQLLEFLGDLYMQMEDYAKAEPLLKEAATTTERALGEHPRLAICLLDEALLHGKRNDYDRASAELERARAIADHTLPPDDLQAIAILNNLGDLYISRKEYERARPLLEQALARVERTAGPDNYRTAKPLLNLAIISREQGDYTHALEYLRRAYDSLEKAYGAENIQPASVLITLGNVYHAQGDYEAALETYQRAYDVLERTAGPYHSYTMMTLSNAARTFAAAGRLDEAFAYQARYDALVEKAIDFNLAIGSEREQAAYLEGTFEKMGRTITLHLTQLPHSTAAADLAATAILRRKGRVLDALAESREALRSHMDDEDRKLLDDYRAVTKKLSQLALNGPGRTSVAVFTKQLGDLEADRGTLESRISARSAQFRLERQPVSLEAVRAALPAHAALVELAVYAPFHPRASADKDQHDPPHYAAYVIRSDADTAGVDLGPAKEIDAAAGHLREALRDPSRTDVSELSRRLDQLVMRPVRAHVGTATDLLIAPDGVLNLIPFGALVDERGRYEVERYAITYLGSGRDILRTQVRPAASGPPMVIADPAFGEPELVPGGPAYFTPLDGTKEEAEVIGRLLPGAVVLTGSRATRSALMQAAAAPSILHIASHAFFLPEGGSEPPPAAKTRSMMPAVQSSNPLLRSGIALAGANLSRPGDSGILTALEASTLNLWGTRLVTLSACDTGLGDVRTGEGVYGLRRAFFVAGAESLVMSLWRVSDQATQTVMTQYYTALARGEGRGAALRRVQLAMLRDPGRRHPFYWAGFIQAGDWRPVR